MVTSNHTHKGNFLSKLSSYQGIWFHLAGILAIIWFLIRVVPKPQRAQYPCQQVALSISLGYIAFWIILFTGLVIWLRNVKTKFAKIAPILLTGFSILFTITGAVFAMNYYRDNELSTVSWDPLPNEPIGTGVGLNPGRVVWVWNPNATEKYLQGYWWEEANNNQSVIDQMVSDGIKHLSGENDNANAWDVLFKYFNKVHGKGDVGYQPGEKIAIKINLNNQYVLFGDGDRTIDDDRDASPYVIKALLKQLVDEVGVAQEDITVFDSSRTIGDWFYHRVYYNSYPTPPLVPEFPNVHYVDAQGDAIGREKVVPSSEKVYFADNTGLTRTLPQNVVDAKYIINMPILKKHPVGNGFTASGKNFFGIFIEPVADGLHQYYTASLTGGNAPQVDLLAAEEVGGKTLLYLGDGTFATKEDHANIAKFNMYPFNGDWTNSLFFSQDPVAIDSVMYDFLFAEGTNPSEASQNYLHIAAAPPPDVYDPEHDGLYLSESLGVHEHWNSTVDIFSPDRYRGVDYIAVGDEYAASGVFITKPILNHLYINGEKIKVSHFTFIIGKIDVEAQANLLYGSSKKMQFYLDGRLEFTDDQAPFVWSWNKPVLIPLKHTIKVVAYYDNSTVYDSITVRKIL